MAIGLDLLFTEEKPRGGRIKMALKDWKKEPNELVWVRDKNKYNIIEIYHEVQKPQIKRWRVKYGTPNIGGNKFFKTKAQALSFAKTYMRSH